MEEIKNQKFTKYGIYGSFYNKNKNIFRDNNPKNLIF